MSSKRSTRVSATGASSRTEGDELLVPLARALVEHPRGTLQELANAIGISKATLYRFCRTREQLINRLVTHSFEMFGEAIRTAALDSAPPLDALRKLIDKNLKHRELTAFALHYWKDSSIERAESEEIEAILDAFFLRGQQENVFRIDIPAAALTEIWNYIWAGLVDAERRGRVARACLAQLIERAFLDGALARPIPSR